ncbi:MAG: proprotein convertase P-domain-containing protein [Verrucomicrobiota bacterium]
MKFIPYPVLGLLLFSAPTVFAATPKTASPVKIKPTQVGKEPYRFNGAVLTDQFRGSGFCAWDNHTFFSAAHVLFDTTWLAPPRWYPAANAAQLDETTAIQSRGYYRWAEYSSLVASSASDGFSQDVILGYSFEKLIKGKAAKINLNGYKDLRKRAKTLITGYPADNLYIEESIEGYFMHKTGPIVTPYVSYDDKALTTTLVTTGHGNSGGPIWTKNSRGGWSAAGVLVGGLPSESVVYAFSKDINSLTRAVTPVIQPIIDEPVSSDKVGASSVFFPYYKEKQIPDGKHEWTVFKIGVDAFPEGAAVEQVALSLDIRTKHRGDLQVVLAGPGGFQALVHNEGGNVKNNLIFNSRDYSADFTGITANGEWSLLVQDRLKGDISTLKSIVLEIAVGDTVVVPPTP